MAEGEGMVKGGGIITPGTQIRRSKVRKYYRKVDLRSVMKPYLESPDMVRRDHLCRQTALKMASKLKTCPPFVGTAVLKALKRVQNENEFEAAMDGVWLHAEARRVLLIS